MSKSGLPGMKSHPNEYAPNPPISAVSPGGRAVPGAVPHTFDHGDNPVPSEYPQHGPALADLPRDVPAQPQQLIQAVADYAQQGQTASVPMPDRREPVNAAPKHAQERGINPKTVIPPKSFQTTSQRWETGTPYAAYGEQFPTSPASR
jgi:hypothetical protein